MVQRIRVHKARILREILLVSSGPSGELAGQQIQPHLQRKIRSETTNAATNHASRIAIGAANCPRLIPCSMFPRSASMAAVSGSARTSG